MTSWTFDLCFRTFPWTLRTVRKLVNSSARIAGAPEELAQDIELAVAEALANVQSHGYGSGIGPVDVNVAFDGRELLLLIQDHGRPIPQRIPIPVAAPASPAGGGRGLYIMGQLMDSIEVVPGPGLRGDGTAVRMAKKLK